MRILFLVVFISISCIKLFSQDGIRVENALSIPFDGKSDSLRISNLLNEGESLLYKKPLLTIQYMDSALHLMHPDSFEFRFARASVVKGIALAMTGSTKDGLLQFQNAKKVYKKREDDENLAKTVNNIANLYRLTGQVDSACAYLFEGLHHNLILKDTSQVIGQYANIAAFFYDYKDYNRAESNIKKALEMEVDSSRFEEFAISYETLGLIVFERAISTSDSSDLNEAMRLFQESDRRALLSGDDRLRASLLSNMAAVTAQSGNTVKAREFFQRALAKQSETGIKHHVMTVITEYGRFESLQGNYLLADSLFEEALILNQNLNSGMEHGAVLSARAENDLKRNLLSSSAEYALEALSVFEDQEAVYQEIDCLNLLIKIYSKSGNDGAIAQHSMALKEKSLAVNDDLNILENVMVRLDRQPPVEIAPEVSDTKPPESSRTLVIILGISLLLIVSYLLWKVRPQGIR